MQKSADYAINTRKTVKQQKLALNQIKELLLRFRPYTEVEIRVVADAVKRIAASYQPPPSEEVDAQLATDTTRRDFALKIVTLNEIIEERPGFVQSGFFDFRNNPTAANSEGNYLRSIRFYASITLGLFQEILEEIIGRPLLVGQSPDGGQGYESVSYFNSKVLANQLTIFSDSAPIRWAGTSIIIRVTREARNRLSASSRPFAAHLLKAIVEQTRRIKALSNPANPEHFETEAIGK